MLVLPQLPRVCGVTAAMGHGREQGWRERPPACALPREGEVALSCAVHDLVTAPGYTPIRDANDDIVGPLAPEYRVTKLQCRYSDDVRNVADCSFELTTPDRVTRSRTVRFENRFWQDHGPTHHMYGTRWAPLSSCVLSEPAG